MQTIRVQVKALLSQSQIQILDSNILDIYTMGGLCIYV